MDMRTTPNKPRISGPKRLRVDNASGATKAHQAASTAPPPIPPHIHLRPQEIPFWNDILRARALDEWGRIELVLAAQLARTQAEIEEGARLIHSGDREQMETKGYPSVRAVRSNISTLLMQQINLMRSLRIVGNVVGDPTQEIPRRKAEREAEQTINRLKQGARMAGDNEDEPPLLSL